MTASGDGYYAEWADLRREALQYGEERDFLRERRDELWQTFLRESPPLGNDQYGAELEKRLPGIRDALFAAFDAYIDEVGGVQERLRVNAVTYEGAEGAGVIPSSRSV
ncbi:hypothetical protein [Streptosporangium sandarakinum]|uniref:Uncharacterized protein n=1 Tax=Streptosporangium sandarakinum TaxID=1260955 RepID=A0A852V1P8_9ACTN|nr:hypothetical protein [Streptosporangium sandarakinum]NYF42399.1 hypothetical protein [Streptosporangium sandarakinum]